MLLSSPRDNRSCSIGYGAERTKRFILESYMEESVSPTLLFFHCIFLYYEKTEPLAVDFYSFGFCFFILHPSAIEQASHENRRRTYKKIYSRILYGRVGFTDSFIFSLYFLYYEKTEPLAVDFYSFGFCFFILHPSAIEQVSYEKPRRTYKKSIHPRNHHAFSVGLFYW